MEIENLLLKITQILEELEISYLVTGGIAVAIWGSPRSTLDIDIIINIRKEQISSLVVAFKRISPAGYADEKMAKKALKEKGEFNFIDSETGLKIDFWVQKEDAFSQNEFQRRVLKKFGSKKAWFISPEDLILRKLQWYKLTETSKHLEDIKSIMKISKVDREYIDHWAKQQSTSEILAKIIKKSSL